MQRGRFHAERAVLVHGRDSLLLHAALALGPEIGGEIYVSHAAYKWIRIGNEIKIKISLTCIQEFGKLSSKSVYLKKKKRAIPTLKRNSTRRNGGKGERVESNRVASLETLTWEAWPVDVAASSLVPSRLADSRDSCCL